MDADIGIIGTFDPTIVLVTNFRYSATIANHTDHPFQVVAKSQSVLGDLVLLSQGATTGLMEDDVTIDWQDDGAGTVSFTLSDSLATAFVDAGKTLGYRSENSNTEMRGNFIVVENLDLDNDGLSNDFEVSLGTNFLEPDTDNDGMIDGWEYNNGFDPFLNDSNEDVDGDGLTNVQEHTLGSDPHKYLLSLKKGWNNISISRKPINNSIATILGSYIMGKVWYWDKEIFRVTNDLEPNTGYWVYAKDDVLIEISLP